jgi:hypothetical protein
MRANEFSNELTLLSRDFVATVFCVCESAGDDLVAVHERIMLPDKSTPNFRERGSNIADWDAGEKLPQDFSFEAV